MVDEKYFKDGEAYERFMGRWSRVGGEVFLDWLSPQPGSSWLDVGCGTGAFTKLIVDRCAPSRVDAIDPAVDQIAYARSRPAATQISYRIGDAQSLPYDDNEFDVATMALVIVFLPDPQAAVKEMARVVKPGGTVATYMWDVLGGRALLQPLFDALEGMNIPVPAMPGFINAQLDTLKGLFEVAGLNQVATRTIDIEVSYVDFEDYWESNTALGHPAVRLIQQMTEADVDHLKSHLREHLPTERDGRIAYAARANAIKGRKLN